PRVGLKIICPTDVAALGHAVEEIRGHEPTDATGRDPSSHQTRVMCHAVVPAQDLVNVSGKSAVGHGEKNAVTVRGPLVPSSSLWITAIFGFGLVARVQFARAHHMPGTGWKSPV